MLLNDSATIAVEVPIYLTPEDFTYFHAHGLTFPIDFLQLRSARLLRDISPD